MAQIYQALRKIEKELVSYLPKAGDAESRRAYEQAKNEIKIIIKNIAFRLGSDLLPKDTTDLRSQEQTWVYEQIAAVLKSLCSADSKVPQDFQNLFYICLTQLHLDCAGSLTTADDDKFRSLKLRFKTEPAKLAWRSVASGGMLVVHAGLLLHTASTSISLAAFLGFWTTAFTALATALVWLANQTEQMLAKINLSGSTALLPLKIVGITLYALLMTPFIVRTLYKNLRNIFSEKYREKRWDSVARLSSSLFFTGAGVVIGIVTGTLGLGGGPLVALGLAALGWGLGYSLHRFYKQRRDRARCFGCSNPQKWWLTRAQLEAVLKKAHPRCDRAKVVSNLVYLAHKLEEIAREEKQFRRKTRSFIFSLTHFLWGWDLNTKKRHCAEEAVCDLKRGNWDKLVACCATGENALGLELDLNNFSIKETRLISVASLVAVTPTLLAAQTSVIPSHPMPATPNLKVSGALGGGLGQSKDSPGDDPSADPVVVRSAVKPDLASGLFGVATTALPTPLPSAPPSAPSLYPHFA